jgi:hypothetical protein
VGTPGCARPRAGRRRASGRLAEREGTHRRWQQARPPCARDRHARRRAEPARTCGASPLSGALVRGLGPGDDIQLFRAWGPHETASLAGPRRPTLRRYQRRQWHGVDGRTRPPAIVGKQDDRPGRPAAPARIGSGERLAGPSDGRAGPLQPEFGCWVSRSATSRTHTRATASGPSPGDSDATAPRSPPTGVPSAGSLPAWRSPARTCPARRSSRYGVRGRPSSSGRRSSPATITRWDAEGARLRR